MAKHPDISQDLLDESAPLAEAIHRRYIEGGGSEQDWVTDFSHLLGAVMPKVIHLPDRRTIELPVQHERRQRVS